MWVVLAASLICMASLSLPWQGFALVVLLCCVAFFELASPAAWVVIRQNHNSRGTKPSLEGPSGVGWSSSPLTAMSRAFHGATERLRGGGGGETEGPEAGLDVVDASEKQSKPKTRATVIQVGSRRQATVLSAVLTTTTVVLL